MSENSCLLFCFQLKGKNIERCKLLIGLVIKAAVEGWCCILQVERPNWMTLSSVTN